MKKYWDSRPGFFIVRDAELCALAVEDYFHIKPKVMKLLADENQFEFNKIVNEVVKELGLKSRHEEADLGIWYVFFETEDKALENLIECFIVAWARGFDDRRYVKRK